jgi:broad specificity phosphatase PhoE
MPYLYLIRHPSTQPDPAIPASQWWLSEAGRAEVRALVDLSIWKAVSTVYTSTQPKTTVVGELVYQTHSIPFVPLVALDEARRDTWLDLEAFDAAQRAFFAHPADPAVRGWEPARSAGLRFIAAMDHLLAVHKPADSLAIVSHASILTLYVAHLREITPSYEQWRKIGFAAVMAVDRAALRPVTPFLSAPYTDLPVP